MRPSNKSRSRKSGGNNQNNQRRNAGNVMNRVYDSAGPDGKVRGTPQQIIDKYQALARDAQLSGDRVIAENYLQHSEHYSRLLGEAVRQQNEQRASQQQEREEAQRAQSESRETTVQQSDNPQLQARPRAEQPVLQSIVNTAGSGLTTIDAQPSSSVGPIETPESKASSVELDPVSNGQSLQPESTNGSHRSASEEKAGGEVTPSKVVQEATPPKRPRARRKAKPSDDGAAAQVE